MVFQRSFIDYIEALHTLRQKPGREDMRRTKMDEPMGTSTSRHGDKTCDKPANQTNP